MAKIYEHFGNLPLDSDWNWDLAVLHYDFLGFAEMLISVIFQWEVPRNSCFRLFPFFVCFLTQIQSEHLLRLLFNNDLDLNMPVDGHEKNEENDVALDFSYFFFLAWFDLGEPILRCWISMSCDFDTSCNNKAMNKCKVLL